MDDDRTGIVTIRSANTFEVLEENSYQPQDATILRAETWRKQLRKSLADDPWTSGLQAKRSGCVHEFLNPRCSKLAAKITAAIRAAWAIRGRLAFPVNLLKLPCCVTVARLLGNRL
jgi:hypothetical protein